MKLTAHLANNPILTNRSLRRLYSGEFLSHFGDALFNLAVMWSIYSHTKSALMTSLVQVVWQLSDAIAGPIAGVVANRWDRKTIMITTTILSAATVTTFALVTAMLGIRIYIALLAIFLMNFWTTFFRPARASVLPEIINTSMYTITVGWFSTGRMVASLIGSAVGGIIVAALGIIWTLIVDAVSFVVLALAIRSVNLPPHAQSPNSERRSMWTELSKGWNTIVSHPIVRPIVFTSMIVNIASFLSPLYPQLVVERLDGNAAAYGMIGAASALASILAGVAVGSLDLRFGTGKLTSFSWIGAGLCTAVVGVSTSMPLTLLFDGLVAFFLTVGGITSGALSTLLIPAQFRGRTFGIIQSMAVLSIPPSAILGGWAADRFGVMPLFVFGGGILLLSGVIVSLHQKMRTASIVQHGSAN